VKLGTAAQISAAAPADASAIAALLCEAGLPHDDLAPHLATFLVARGAGQKIIGAIGAEPCGTDALLRSLVVEPAARGAGLAGQLLAALERAAAGWGVTRWWLLTTTAEKFFAAHGFVVVARASAPPAIQRTRQFSGACCAAAACMTRERRERS